MSRLYFETEDETAEIRGWEYHWLRGMADDVARGFLGLDYDADTWLPLINPSHYMSKYTAAGASRHEWARMFEVALRADGGGGVPLLVWKGKPVNGWHLMLNTGLALGNDAVKLATRLGAQGEIHAWIDGPDRAWVADMIEGAVKAGVYREGLRRTTGEPMDKINGVPDPARLLPLEPAGWTEVVALLRADDTGPVVTHYSVSEGFPDRRLIAASEEGWEQMSRSLQWHLCMESLRHGGWAERFSGLQIKPTDWDTFRYGHMLTVLDLRAPDRATRLDRALAKGWLK